MLTGNSFIRGNLGPEGNLEAVVYLPGEKRLQHYFRVPKTGEGWRRGYVLSERATGPGCLLQSAVGSPGNFEAVAVEGGDLVHLWHDNTRMDLPFQRGAVMATGVTGGVSLIQNRVNRDLELVARFGTTLRHFWLSPGSAWKTGGVITSEANGEATLFQSPGTDRLECVVREGQRLVLYVQDGGNWERGGVLSIGVTGAASVLDDVAVVPEGDSLRLYRRDGIGPNSPWRATTIVSGGGPFVAVSLIRHRDGTLGILAQEGSGSVFEYGQDGSRWQRVACLRIDEGPFAGERDREQSQLVARVTQGNPRIQGTDLGVSFEHRGRLYFLFGDTGRTSDPARSDWDAVATTDATEFRSGFPLTFHPSYPKIVEPEVPQGAFAVPADGFSHDGHLYAFFTTDPFTRNRVMGRSVLTRCREDVPDMESPRPLLFENLGTFSDRHFINLSVEVADEEKMARWGMPRVGGARRGLLLWGSGSYRTSDLRLAYLPLTGDLRQRAPLYWNGRGWSSKEEEATPLFSPGAVGELSVCWNPVLERFVLLYCSGPEDPIGLAVQLRVSRKPQGPWSRRRLALDWQRYGLGKYMHLAGANDGLDNGSGAGGAGYAPYQIVRATEPTNGGVRLYYLLSCWNPYHVVLLRHDLSRADVAAMEAGTSRPV